MTSKSKEISPYIALNENKLPYVTDAINKIISGFPGEARPVSRGMGTDILYHYTSIDKLFKILDGDSLWASRSRFSNDSTEGIILGNEWLNDKPYYGDNYIVCFCEDNDKLSQWRGYCFEGGASIGFKFINNSTYTICHTNSKDMLLKSRPHMELYKNTPLPVIYCRTYPQAENDSGINIEENLISSCKSIIDNSHISICDVIPYFKSGFFVEEREYRLMFDNSDGELEEFIQFRELNDGTKIPYIVVKSGDLLNEEHSLKRYYTERKIEDIFKDHIDSLIREPIVIPVGEDQKDICRAFTEQFNKHKIERKKNLLLESRWNINPLRILCEGHLPIVSITVSPSPKQEYIKEVIERFCKSKYWLQNVEVNCSKIPYVNPNL